ncbi:MAG: hypothetical protein LUG85_07280 [Clostridiales bacterium]|nr:hypothetical protein [Clostridiales bacterium]
MEKFKFKIVLKNENALGLNDCPVQVEKYNILFNNSTEKNVIQLKLRNRAEKHIKSVYMEIDCFDDTKDKLGTLNDIVYLDANAAQGEAFGSRQAINTDFSVISNINIKITKVAFCDETVWRNDNGAYLIEFPQPTEAGGYFGALYSQYKREAEKINACSSYAYDEKENFWQCSCGQNNDLNNKSCFVCNTERSKLQTISDLQYLSEENKKYLIAQEQERQRLEAQRKKLEEEQKIQDQLNAEKLQEQKEKNKKLLVKIGKICAVSVIVICVVIAGIFTVSHIINKSKLSAALEAALEARVTLDAGTHHTLVLNDDGTVSAIGDNDYGQCDVDNWDDIIAVSTGSFHTVGLKSDGTVVAVGINNFGQCNVDDWNDIVAVSVGSFHTIGLKSDGTVVAVGGNSSDQCNVDNWNDIIAVSAGDYYTVGLKSDGTVVAVGINNFGQCNVDEWNDIVAVSAGDDYTVGLKSDGTVVAVGGNSFDQCNVDDWDDIVAVSAGYKHTVGLKSDGTVVAVGYNTYDQCDIDDWDDIVAISAGYKHTVGLKSDGTVVAVGNNTYGQCDVDDLKSNNE